MLDKGGHDGQYLSMVRPVRLDYPGTFYHVLFRGNERREIFRDKKDYERFIDILAEMADKFRIEVHAFVLMPNHYHLLLKTQEPNLSKGVQWLGVCYSTWINRRHNRSGHLFQGRFKSFIIEDDRYLAALSLYIHRNPIRAGLVEVLSSYQWSSYHVCSGEKELPWLETSVVLGIYGNDRKSFIGAQKEYAKEEGFILEKLRHGLFLGSVEFAKRFKSQLEEERNREKPQAIRALRSRDIGEAIKTIMHQLGEEPAGSIMSPLRRVSRPTRDMAIYILSRMGTFTHKDIGQRFGVWYTCIPGAIKRAKECLGKENSLREKVQRIQMIYEDVTPDTPPDTPGDEIEFV